jgi:hypothetical protein
VNRKLLIFVITLTSAIYCKASESYLSSNLRAEDPRPNFKLENNSLLFAQATDDDAFDPFSDYSEFDEATDEEADINFFKNGRFLTVGLQLGFKGFTGDLSSDYTAGGVYGLYLSYFFDLRFALQFGFSTGDYSFYFQDANGVPDAGNINFSLLQLDAKYYFNTQNVTKGRAELNPYILFGLSDVFRTETLTSSTSGAALNASTSAWGLDLGAGIEIPILKKKCYYGVQATFHYINFPDSNGPFPIVDDNNAPSTMSQRGYQYDLLGLVGVNF